MPSGTGRMLAMPVAHGLGLETQTWANALSFGAGISPAHAYTIFLVFTVLP